MTARDEDVMARLDLAIERLSHTGASLDELIAAHQEGLKLLEEAEAELARLKSRAAELSEALKT